MANVFLCHLKTFYSSDIWLVTIKTKDIRVYVLTITQKVNTNDSARVWLSLHDGDIVTPCGQVDENHEA